MDQFPDAFLADLVSVPMFEQPAADMLPEGVRNYVWGGAGEEHTLRDNVAAWERIALAPRVLRDVSQIDIRTSLLGIDLAHPILVAPTAQHRNYTADGELATIEAAAGAEALYVQSSLGSTDLDSVGRCAAGHDVPWWFQLYIQRDRGFTADLVATAAASGAKALVLTVDTPTLGARDRDKRNQLGRIDGSHYPILASAPLAPDTAPPHRRVYNPLLAPDITFDDLEWLVGAAGVPVLTKGHMRADDALRAVECGASGVIVSNHGARNLDTVPATAMALPGIVAALAGRVPVLVDGGVRRGTDVAKALALGADAVLVGRPVIWGLSVGGAQGAQQVLEILRTELEMAMALLGTATLAELTPDILWPAGALTDR
ncbi:MAG: alpha-hydroxy acid oxidase [Candidatus Nanopelagicales bacterium]